MAGLVGEGGPLAALEGQLDLAGAHTGGGLGLGQQVHAHELSARGHHLARGQAQQHMGLVAEEAVLKQPRQALLVVMSQQEPDDGAVSPLAHRGIEVHEVLMGEAGVEHALNARLASHGPLVVDPIAHVHSTEVGRVLDAVGIHEVDGIEGGDLADGAQPLLARGHLGGIGGFRGQGRDGLDVLLGVLHECGHELGRLIGGIGDVLARLGYDAVARLLHEHGERDDDGHEHDDEGRH